MDKQKIQAQIKKKEEEIKVLKNKLISTNLKSKSGYIHVPEIDKDVEIEVHDKNKSFDDLKKIYGDNFESMLLTKEECEKILKNKEISKLLKMDGSSRDDDFFIQQFNEDDKKKGYVAFFYVGGVWSYFYSNGDSGDSFDCRGVRFVRKKISTNRKKR
jgi:hypothetical protein